MNRPFKSMKSATVSLLCLLFSRINRPRFFSISPQALVSSYLFLYNGEASWWCRMIIRAELFFEPTWPLCTFPQSYAVKRGTLALMACLRIGFWANMAKVHNVFPGWQPEILFWNRSQPQGCSAQVKPSMVQVECYSLCHACGVSFCSPKLNLYLDS